MSVLLSALEPLCPASLYLRLTGLSVASVPQQISCHKKQADYYQAHCQPYASILNHQGCFAGGRLHRHRLVLFHIGFLVILYAFYPFLQVFLIISVILQIRPVINLIGGDSRIVSDVEYILRQKRFPNRF